MSTRDYYTQQRRYSRERQTPGYPRYQRPRYPQSSSSSYRGDRYYSNRRDAPLSSSAYSQKQYRQDSYQYSDYDKAGYSYQSYNRIQDRKRGGAAGTAYSKKDAEYNNKYRNQEQRKYQTEPKKYQTEHIVHAFDKRKIQRKIQNHKVNCPFLVRTFLTRNFPVQVEQFTLDGKVPKIGQVHIYCWLDSNLRDIIDLLKYPINELRTANIEVLIYSIYISPEGKFIRKKLGNVLSEKRGKDDFTELQNNQFKPGDFLNVVIFDKEKQGQKEMLEAQQKSSKNKNEEQEKLQSKSNQKNYSDPQSSQPKSKGIKNEDNEDQYEEDQDEDHDQKNQKNQ